MLEKILSLGIKKRFYVLPHPYGFEGFTRLVNYLGSADRFFLSETALEI